MQSIAKVNTEQKPTKRLKVNYELFYAIKFSISVGKKPAFVREFYGISTSTYSRIAACRDYAAYKRATGSRAIDGSDKLAPTGSMQDRKHKATKSTLAETSKILSQAKELLEIAERLTGSSSSYSPKIVGGYTPKEVTTAAIKLRKWFSKR